MRELLRKHHISFKNAANGVFWAIRTQPNFRVHLVLSSIALALAWYFSLTRFEWIVIIFTILLGLTGEMLNTAVEAVTDLITTEWRKEAKIAKDVSAGMMLIIAIGACIIGMIIFMPYIVNLSNT